MSPTIKRRWRAGFGSALLLALAPACGGSTLKDPGGQGGGSAANAGAGGSAQAGSSTGGFGVAGGAGGGNNGGGSGGFAGGPAPDIGPQRTADKLDVLFVVDNSTSMAGKQKTLATSVPNFVTKLSQLSHDIHFGVITTSIGAHGGTSVCQIDATHHNDDQAQLLPSKRTGVQSYMDSGYLAFDASNAAGVSDAAQVGTQLAAMINAVGEDGCGYEAPLEAMYRFLVDPEPPLSVALVQQQSTPMGINALLLKQRAAFLRPDSSVAIVILSDENDCSILDEGIAWFVTASARMPLSTGACAANPNDPCCRSCAQRETEPPAGCQPLPEDSVCKNVPAGQSFATWDVLHDNLNLRCFDQQRRFGFDLLQPVGRYSNALSSPKISNRAGMLVENPLFAVRDGQGPRSASLISVSVIVGAPWQDLATPASLSAPPLEFLDGAGLASAGRWPLLIGDRSKNVPPSDAFMIESILPRTGLNPLTQTATVPASSQDPKASAINGHEENVPDFGDLQHACSFPLEVPIDCKPQGPICECSPDSNGDTTFLVSVNSALCQPPAGGAAGTTQYYGKGYPSTRELEFARDLGARATAGSVCPKANPSDASEVGYTAALNALTGRLGATLK